jgi:tetratricopeptide (TPR) repeat protein
MIDKFWSGLQVWGVPVGMAGAYAMLIWSADTDTTGKAWLAMGFAFVLVVWFIFRILTTQAALSRAIAIGDSAKLLETTGKQLARLKTDADRAPYHVARAFAHELRAEWSDALAELDKANLAALPPAKRAPWQLRASMTRIAALVETNRIADARRVLDAELRPDAPHVLHSDAYLAANLAAGRVLAAEGKRDEAAARLRKVADDVRATSAMRAAVERLEVVPVERHA